MLLRDRESGDSATLRIVSPAGSSCSAVGRGPIPVAITRHERTVGYYVPARGCQDEEEVLALRRAVEHLQALLAEQGISEDAVV